MAKTATVAKPVVSAKEWKAPDRIAINRKPGFKYCMATKRNVPRKQAEGWVIASDGELLAAEAGSMDGGQHYRSHVLMKMPKKMADQRSAHYIEKHNRRVRAAFKGSQLNSAADKINQSSGGKVASTIGKIISREELVDSQGNAKNRTQRHVQKAGEEGEQGVEE